MHTHFENMSTRLFSPRLWRGFGAPQNMNPLGSSYQTPSGNSAFGFFDDFLSFSETTLVGPYAMLETATGAITKVADTADAKGILAFVTAGDTAEDELVMKWGSTASAPFKLEDKDLVFECRLALSAITTGKNSIGVGLGDAGMIATDEFWTDSDIMAANADWLGFAKLVGETADFDGAYQDAGGAYVDGATKTKLDALATFTASATTYHKLGFRYRAHPQTVEWYVDGVMPGGKITPARLTAAECSVADTFPDDVFLAPIIGIKDKAGDLALTVNMDWWACAQYE